MHRSWTRLCVDLDDVGHPIGTSYERHVEDEVVEFGMGPLPGPFDDGLDAWKAIEADVISRYGRQAELPLRPAKTS